MTTKRKAQRKLEEEKKKEELWTPTERKVKEFIKSMINYYKEKKDREDKKEDAAFNYNILTKNLINKLKFLQQSTKPIHFYPSFSYFFYVYIGINYTTTPLFFDYSNKIQSELRTAMH